MVLSDIEIANSVQMKPIKEVARKARGTEDALSLYGNYRISAAQLGRKRQPDAKLILVTILSPTPARRKVRPTFCADWSMLWRTIGKSRYRSAGNLHSDLSLVSKVELLVAGTLRWCLWRTSTSTSLVTFMPSVLPTTYWRPLIDNHPCEQLRRR